MIFDFEKYKDIGLLYFFMLDKDLQLVFNFLCEITKSASFIFPLRNGPEISVKIAKNRFFFKNLVKTAFQKNIISIFRGDYESAIKSANFVPQI